LKRGEYKIKSLYITILRVNSIAEQSTRYCNYSKDKFGNELTFCIPSWLNLPEGDAYWYDGINYRIQPKNDPNFEATISVRPGDYFTKEQAEELDVWLDSLDVAEHHYMNLISKGWQPQQAREVLPLCTATEIIHTAFVSDWRHFFDLRYFGTTGAPHPNMVELTGLMAKEADKYGIWKELCNQNVEKA
jgi:thymidylate synthase (FAD)